MYRPLKLPLIFELLRAFDETSLESTPIMSSVRRLICDYKEELSRTSEFRIINEPGLPISQFHITATPSICLGSQTQEQFLVELMATKFPGWLVFTLQ